MSVTSKSNSSKLPTLRFRAKIILGFVAVLAILAVSMAFAYFGFERIQAAVASYRTSVAEADLARTVDRDLPALGRCVDDGPVWLQARARPPRGDRRDAAAAQLKSRDIEARAALLQRQDLSRPRLEPAHEDLDCLRLHAWP